LLIVSKAPEAVSNVLGIVLSSHLANIQEVFRASHDLPIELVQELAGIAQSFSDRQLNTMQNSVAK
jgi:hypothetical protein